MSFTDNKITPFTHRISELADQPNLSADELKARFDSSPEELRVAHNAVCDDAAILENKVDSIITQTFEGVVDKMCIRDRDYTGVNNNSVASLQWTNPSTGETRDYADMEQAYTNSKWNLSITTKTAGTLTVTVDTDKDGFYDDGTLINETLAAGRNYDEDLFLSLIHISLFHRSQAVPAE